MKNMKVAVKLLFGFTMMIVISVIVGVVGIVGMSSLSKADGEMYDYNVLAIETMGEIREVLQRQRVVTREFAVYSGHATMAQSLLAEMNELESTMESLFAEYERSVTDTVAEAAYFDAKKLYLNEYAAIKKDIQEACKTNIYSGQAALEDPDVVSITNALVDGFTLSMHNNGEWAKETVDSNAKLFRTMLIIAIIVMIIGAVVAVLLSLKISSLISLPIKNMAASLTNVGTVGDLVYDEETERHAAEEGKRKDEIGMLSRALTSLVVRLRGMESDIMRVAEGDLTLEVKLLSDKDNVGLSLKKMVDNLNNMFGEINLSTAQVTSGAKQIADGSQALAQGSTQQAAAVEQLSSSISEIAHKTKANAEMAEKAADLAGTIKHNAEKGSRQMDHMMEAVKEINQASQSIGKVIKVIDDIAFQTNILALNAAVEAARAGQHGKGFAVVAEEVRNLASKSAAAARDTGGLIANSIEKAELGSRIADETASSLAEIVSGINESTQLVGDIAKSSEDQTIGIEQINKGIDQVAQVVQQNSATAEESAAASEEMSGQANMLEELVSQFKLRDGSSRALTSRSDSGASGGSGNAAKKLSMPEKTTYAPTSNGDFGKY